MDAWFWPPSTTETSFIVRLARMLHGVAYAGATMLMLAGAVEAFSRVREHSNSWHEVLSFAFALAFGTAVLGRGLRYLLANE